MTRLEVAARRFHDLAVQISWIEDDLAMAKRSGYPAETARIERVIAALKEERAELGRELETSRRAE